MQCYLPNNEDQRSEGEREGGREDACKHMHYK